MSLQAIAQQIAAQGRGNDTQLVHMSTKEVAGLQALAAQHGMQLPQNPRTGLIEANFLDSILPAVAGIGLMAFAPELAPFLGESAAGFLGTSTGAGLAVGGADALATGSLKKGLMAGLGAYGGAELGSALGAAGSTTPAVTGISAAPTVGAPAGASAGLQNAGDVFRAAQGIPTTATTAAESGLQNAGDVFRAAQGLPSAAPSVAQTVASSGITTTPSVISEALPGTATPSLGSMGKGLASLGNGGGSTFMDTLGSTGPFSTPGYNQMFKAGATLAPIVADTSAAAPNNAITNLQNTVRPYTFTRTPTAAPGAPGDASKSYFNQYFTALPTYVAGTNQPSTIPTSQPLAGGGLASGFPRGDTLHGTIGGLRGVERLTRMASGGISNLGSYSDGGQLLRGPGDGVSDSIPAQIGQHQPARLAEGEFVVPARIVSELGNGSTNAGAKQLYSMIDRIQAGRRKTVGGKHAYADDTNAADHLPA